MAHATISAPFGSSSGNRTIKRTLTVVAWTGIVMLAVGFVFKYVLFYYRHYDAASFDVYWHRRGWLLLHISGGTLALLTGPFQFWMGLRQRYMNVHRWLGRVYLVGVAAGIVGAVGLSLTTTFGWAVVWGIRGLAVAWLVTTGTAYFTITKGLVALHKEWMIRAYVVTFAFVTFRLMQDYGPISKLRPENDRDITIAWACWVVPLFITEMFLQFKRIRLALAAR